MTYDDLKRMEDYTTSVRQNAFKDCAARILQVVDYHLAANPGVGVADMNEEQLRGLVSDVMLLADQIETYGERLVDGEE